MVLTCRRTKTYSKKMMFSVWKINNTKNKKTNRTHIHTQTNINLISSMVKCKHWKLNHLTFRSFCIFDYSPMQSWYSTRFYFRTKLKNVRHLSQIIQKKFTRYSWYEKVALVILTGEGEGVKIEFLAVTSFGQRPLNFRANLSKNTLCT